MSRDNVKIIVTCNSCGKRVSTNSRQISTCKCGSNDLLVDDQWDLFLDKYAESRKETWHKHSKGVRA